MQLSLVTLSPGIEAGIGQNMVFLYVTASESDLTIVIRGNWKIHSLTSLTKVQIQGFLGNQQHSSSQKN